VYDDGIRTPFIVQWPAQVKAGQTTDSLVSSIDIAPTVLELAGVEIGPTFQGVSFAPVLSDPMARVRDYAFAEHNWHDYMARERAVRSSRFAYIRNWRPDLPGTPPADAVNSPTFAEMKRRRDAGTDDPIELLCFQTPRPAEELYDISADPHSLRNLATDPRYSDVMGEMRTALQVWQQETRDLMPDELTPDGFHRETGRRLPGVAAPHPSLK
jgi:arylsulfatase A-like enzyme